jgi:CHAT domain-containing protein
MLLFIGIGILPVTAQAPSSPSTQVAESANTLVKRGREHYDKGEYRDAIQDLKQAYEKAEDTLNQAMILSNLSLAYQQVGKWQEARQTITKASEQLNRFSSNNSDSEVKLAAQIMLVKGQLEMAVGQPEEALQAWQTAYTEFDRIKDTIGKQRSQLYQVLSLQELGFHRQALKTLLGIPEVFQDSNPLSERTIAYRTLGNLLRIIGFSEDFKKLGELIFQEQDKKITSKNYLEQSQFFLYKSLKVAKSDQDKAEAWLGLGNTSLAAYKRAQDTYERTATEDKDDKSKAVIDKLDETLFLYKQAETTNKEAGVANSLIFSGIQAQLNQYSLLLDYIGWITTTKQDQNNLLLTRNLMPDLEQLQGNIRTNLEKLHSNYVLVNARINFASSLIKQNKIDQNYFNNQKGKAFLQESKPSDFRQIEKWLDDTRKLAEDIQDVRGESYSLGYLGKLHEQYGREDDAYEYTKKALIKAEAVAEQGKNVQTLAYQWQWQLGRIFSRRVEIKEAIAAYAEAVKILESLRGDLVSFNNPDIQFSFRDSVEPVYREYVGLLLSDQGTSGNLSRVSEAQEALQKAQRAIEDLQVAELENFLKCQLTNTRRAPIYKVIDEKNLNAATIYTIILEDRLEVILKVPGKNQLFHYSTKDLRKESVEEELIKLRKAVEDGRSPKYNSDDDSTSLKVVYDWILGDLMADDKLKNSGAKTLIFVLDGALRNIPMAALYDGKQFLIEKYSIALNLGIEFSDRKPLQAGQFKVLAAGLNKELPGVEKELEQLKSTYQSRVTVLRDEKFSAKNIQEQIIQQNFDIIHLGTHGLFSSDPETTYIRTFDKNEKLNVNEMEQILRKRTADRLDTIGLLFLSACQTAKGDKRATLGIAGMAVRTGANSVIATLFDAPDAIAPELVAAFYKELGKPNITKADALRHAQLQLLQNSGGNSDQNTLPRNWAPFIMIGNWQ